MVDRAQGALLQQRIICRTRALPAILAPQRRRSRQAQQLQCT
jgi:hypothetical protein